MTEPALKEGPENWYRNEVWSFRTECAFLEKLGRTRGQGPQYLAIQISHLAEGAPQDALRLADLYFEDWSDPMYDGGVHMSRARAHQSLEDIEQAAASYHDALTWQAAHPNYQVGAELSFALLVAQHGLVARYDAAREALARVDADTLMFPLERFRFHAAHALLAETEGADEEVLRRTRLALAEAQHQTSGLKWHPHLGLVQFDDPVLHRLRRLLRSKE